MPERGFTLLEIMLV
ncbi:prepilin-type N-terminal cleavage/methylation domain-containing protein, partial [Escherichia coli]|nr:prepilin-type N-terminal cleavage/methylation domain-containing protein [Escherichia coli]